MSSLDRISPLLEGLRVRTSLFHAGPLCGVTTFPAEPGRGFLHVLRSGEMTVTHRDAEGRLARTEITEPSLVFYPRPLTHAFHNAPTDGSDFACAALDVEGGANHPLVRTLPPVIVLPLAAVDTLPPALDLLFAEVDNVRCGRRIVADRLFEVVLIHLYRWLLDHAGELGLPPGLLPALADPRLAPVLVAIHEQPGREWHLATMAQTAAMSRSSFAALFKQRVGETPAEYLTCWRIAVAQEQLRAGSPVAVTAAAVGYTHPATFTRAFSQRVGCSPRAWLVEHASSAVTRC